MRPLKTSDQLATCELEKHSILAPLCTINTVNPTGIRGKEEIVLSLAKGITNIAETHLTLEGSKACQRSLRHLARSSQRNLRILPGAPVPPRTGSQTTGIHAGTMQLADLPAHALTIPWPSGEYTAGRAQLGRFLWPHLPITGAVLYGWAPGPTWPRARQATQKMLEHLTQQVVFGCAGARFIAGDFNGDESHYSVLQVWQQMGWQEIQDLQFHRTGQGPWPTCKHLTRPDRLYVSPELARFFQSAAVDDIFAKGICLNIFF